VHHDQRALSSKLDRAGKEVVAHDRARRIVRVVQVEEVRSFPDCVGYAVEIGLKAVLFRERQIVDLGSREDWA
jgi:hypothetical protein